MKRQTLSALLAPLLLAALAAQPLLAADYYPNYPRQNGSPPPVTLLEWRLGDSGRHGHEILYRARGDRGWRLAPGTAIDVGDGWVIGTNRENGGYGIYRWDGRGWQQMPGAGVEIGGSYSNPWVINDRGERFNWTGFDWRREYVNFRRDRDNRRRDDRHDRDHDDERGRRDR